MRQESIDIVACRKWWRGINQFVGNGLLVNKCHCSPRLCCSTETPSHDMTLYDIIWHGPVLYCSSMATVPFATPLQIQWEGEESEAGLYPLKKSDEVDGWIPLPSRKQLCWQLRFTALRMKGFRIRPSSCSIPCVCYSFIHSKSQCAFPCLCVSCQEVTCWQGQ